MFSAKSAQVKNKLYHGTSDVVNIKNIILPSVETGVLREDFRGKNLDVCFATSSLLSARNYAQKAVFKYGGQPVVFEVEPAGLISNINTNEYICKKFKIIKRIDLKCLKKNISRASTYQIF